MYSIHMGLSRKRTNQANPLANNHIPHNIFGCQTWENAQFSDQVCL